MDERHVVVEGEAELDLFQPSGHSRFEAVGGACWRWFPVRPPFSEVAVEFSGGDFALFNALPGRLGGVEAYEDGVLYFGELDHGDVAAEEGVCAVVIGEFNVAVEIGD